MKYFKLNDMIKGWFVGDFEPSALKTSAVEVAVKKYLKGDYEASHYHRVATELTLILSGYVVMAGEEFKSGDIVVLNPSEVTDFRAVEDTITVVVKLPSVLNDKFSV